MKKRILCLVMVAALVIGITPTLTAVAEEKASPSYKEVLTDTMKQLAETVTEPKFGTSGGEWTVLSLARGGHFELGDKYFEDYYQRVATKVKELETAALEKGLKAGALDKNKSTENSRVILALTAINKDPSDVGGVNLVGAFDENGFDWIKKQGINGPIFALLALDTKNFETKDATLRQQCIDFILSKELEGGGWALSGKAADPDITSMALQALAKYKTDEKVLAAANRAIAALSNMQQTTGGFASWGSVNSESIAQVITALSAWGVDTGTDTRFVKEGNSAIDALLAFYKDADKGFSHTPTGAVNAMATDQACYALVAYDRLKEGKTALYDMTDVGVTPPEETEESTEAESESETQGEPESQSEQEKQSMLDQQSETFANSETEAMPSNGTETSDTSSIIPSLIIFVLAGLALTTTLIISNRRREER